MSRQGKNDNVEESLHSQPTNVCCKAHVTANYCHDKTQAIEFFPSHRDVREGVAEMPAALRDRTQPKHLGFGVCVFQVCLLAQSINGTMPDPAKYGGPPASNVCSHRMQPCNLVGFSFRWPEPFAILTMGLFARDPAGCFDMPMTEGLVDGFSGIPGLAAKERCLSGHTFVELGLDAGRHPSVDKWVG
jgi:hypothetical protein